MKNQRQNVLHLKKGKTCCIFSPSNSQYFLPPFTLFVLLCQNPTSHSPIAHCHHPSLASSLPLHPLAFQVVVVVFWGVSHGYFFFLVQSFGWWFVQLYLHFVDFENQEIFFILQLNMKNDFHSIFKLAITNLKIFFSMYNNLF